MKTSRLGCLSVSGLLSILITLLLITGISLAQGGSLFSPGELNAQAGARQLGGASSHADTAGRCSACHAPFWSRAHMADLCLDCHSELKTNPQNFHTIMLAQSSGLNCVRCHTDHRGPQASLTLLDMQEFPHLDAAHFSLDAHQRRADGSAFLCEDCHGTELAEFEALTCRECHQQHDPVYAQAHQDDFGDNCLACHDGVDTYGADFDHNRLAFVLLDGHAGRECSDCHTNARSLPDLLSTPQDCYGCHAQDDEHNGQFGPDCEQCHKPVSWEEVTFDHARSDFPLLGAHAAVECEACHQNGVFQDTPQDCFACHAQDDEHDGQFGQDCAQCHTSETWEDASFDHSLAAFALIGAHANVPCQDCHVNQVFKGTPQDCFACHAQDDEHGGQFGQDCAQCHTSETWEGASFDHSLAAFALTGAHVNVPCQDCHVNQVFKGTSQTCAACHADPTYHLGLFNSDCAACHSTSAWRPASYNDRHTFPINHGETRNTCDVCHPSSLGQYTCYGCHEHNPSRIESEHREEGIGNFQDCVRCHASGNEEEGGDD